MVGGDFFPRWLGALFLLGLFVGLPAVTAGVGYLAYRVVRAAILGWGL